MSEKNIYKRNDGRYEARYIKGRNENGKAIYGTVYGHSIKEVQEKRKHATEELGYSVTQIIEKYLFSIKKNIKSSTYIVYKGYITNYISQYFKEMKYEQLSEEIIQAFADWLIENGLSVATVQGIFDFIKRGFSDKQNIFDIDLSNYKDMDYLTIEEQKRLESAAKFYDEDIYIAVILCLYMGLTASEVCNAKWTDIDFNNRLLYVKRTVPIPNFLINLLKKHKDNNRIYILSDDKPIKPRNIQYHLQVLLEETGIRQINFYVLRNTFAVRALENGTDILTLSKLLGHSKPEITIKRYGHLIKEELMWQCMEKMILVWKYRISIVKEDYLINS